MILRDIKPARAVDDTDLTDLTTARQTAPAYWLSEEVDALCVPMDAEPSESEARAIRDRLVTVDDADEAHLRDLRAASRDSSAPEWARTLAVAELARYGE